MDKIKLDIGWHIRHPHNHAVMEQRMMLTGNEEIDKEIRKIAESLKLGVIEPDLDREVLIGE